MPYLNLDLDYFSHPKVMRLVGLIGAEHVAFPIKLWCHTAKYHCESGVLPAYSIQELESTLGWTGPSTILVEALVKIGFIEKYRDGFRIHDWKEHAGHLVAFKKRAKSGAKARWQKYASSIAKSKITTAPNQPILTVPTKPTKPLVTKAQRRAALEAYVVPEETRTWARAEFGVEIPDDVVREFKDHWANATKLRMDWDATFRNRIRQLVGWKVLVRGQAGAQGIAAWKEKFLAAEEGTA